MNTTCTKHETTTLNEEKKLVCQSCNSIIMSLDQLSTLHDLNRRFFNGDFTEEEYTTKMKSLKEIIDASKTN